MGKGLPPEKTLDEVVVRIKESYSNPNVRRVHQVVLKDGKRILRVASVMEIVDQAGAFHHYSLKIDSIDRLKSGWFHKPEKSVRLDGDDPNEIDILYKFLAALLGGQFDQKAGELHVIGSDQYAKLGQFLEAFPELASSDQIELVKAILPHLDGSALKVQDFVTALKHSDQAIVNNLAIASKFVEYSNSYEKFMHLVNDTSSNESVLQAHLQKNPWMFGSEYSELLDRRKWTRDNSLDFMLRRTVDDFLEIIEIKTPFSDPLLIYDKSHDSWYPSAKLSSVLGQVMRYIEEVERNRDSILCKDGFDTLKIRARVIIGRNGQEAHQIALRNLNDHLHRIEIITFDQLLRIAERVINVFRYEPTEDDILSASRWDDEIPF